MEYYESLRVVSRWKSVAPFILKLIQHNIVTLEIIKTLTQTSCVDPPPLQYYIIVD